MVIRGLRTAICLGWIRLLFRGISRFELTYFIIYFFGVYMYGLEK